MSASPLRVAVLTMHWPAPSETFAAVDVRQMARQGVEVQVHAMRARCGHADRMLAERGVAEVASSSARWCDLAVAVKESLLHPISTMALIARVVAWGAARPRHLLAGLLLVPRSLAIAADLERWRPDVVHLFWGHFPCVAGWLMRRRHPRAVISMFLGAYDVRAAYAGSAALASQADVLLTHAEVNRADIARLGIDAGRVQVVYRGVDPAIFASGPGSRIPGRVVAVGRLIGWKRMADVLEVFAAVRKERPEATLRIVGDGPERQALEQQAARLGIQEAVGFRGHIGHGAVLAELDQAEVMLLLSDAEERLSNAVKEAMARGCYVVVSRSPGIDELVEDGVGGSIVEVGDIAAASRALSAALSDPERRSRAAAAALVRLRDRFDAGANMRLQVSLWRRSVDGRRPS